MTNKSLAKDYLVRAHGRRKAIQTLFDSNLFADVVRECQESLELALKGMIRHVGHVVPLNHDVSAKLSEMRLDLPAELQAQLPRLIEISKKMRRDREIAFYGSEDITPSEFYDQAAATQAMSELDEVLSLIPQDFAG